MNEPAIPTRIVIGMLIGSRPGSASRASAPTISPWSAIRMRYASRLTL